MGLKVTKLDKDFVKGETEYERYAFAYWRNVSDMLRKNDEVNDVVNDEIDNIECIVKISAGKKHVYRKLRSSNKFDEDKIGLGYRTTLELGVKQDNNEEVDIKKSCWFLYLWCHVDSTIKCPFRLAVVALILALPSFFETIMNLINLLK